MIAYTPTHHLLNCVIPRVACFQSARMVDILEGGCCSAAMLPNNCAR